VLLLRVLAGFGRLLWAARRLLLLRRLIPLRHTVLLILLGRLLLFRRGLLVRLLPLRLGLWHRCVFLRRLSLEERADRRSAPTGQCLSLDRFEPSDGEHGDE